MFFATAVNLLHCFGCTELIYFFVLSRVHHDGWCDLVTFVCVMSSVCTVSGTFVLYVALRGKFVCCMCAS